MRLDSILIGVVIFILGILVGVLGSTWWQGRKRKEAKPVAIATHSEIQSVSALEILRRP